MCAGGGEERVCAEVKIRGSECVSVYVGVCVCV